MMLSVLHRFSFQLWTVLFWESRFWERDISNNDVNKIASLRTPCLYQFLIGSRCCANILNYITILNNYGCLLSVYVMAWLCNSTSINRHKTSNRRQETLSGSHLRSWNEFCSVHEVTIVCSLQKLKNATKYRSVGAFVLGCPAGT